MWKKSKYHTLYAELALTKDRSFTKILLQNLKEKQKISLFSYWNRKGRSQTALYAFWVKIIFMFYYKIVAFIMFLFHFMPNFE